jgi:hypothetical protein
MSNPAPLPAEQGPLVRSRTDKVSGVDDFSPNEPVHFVLPRRALAAIHPMAIIAEARRDGVDPVRIGVDDRGASASETHLTCGSRRSGKVRPYIGGGFSRRKPVCHRRTRLARSTPCAPARAARGHRPGELELVRVGRGSSGLERRADTLAAVVALLGH